MSLPPEKASELKQLIHQQLSKVRGAVLGELGSPARLAVRSLGPGPLHTGLPRTRARDGQSFGFEARRTSSLNEREQAQVPQSSITEVIERCSYDRTVKKKNSSSDFCK